ncbi:olfactory receptor 5A1-like [Macrotis lagotis]|uniref:olfactory receptor 5A1-like n=1 Tax=Macrotis lagotis TaxID=92651 RepID=UPI003D69406D
MATGRNTTTVTRFILLGFNEHPELQVFLFVLFLGIYFMTLAWNVSLIILIKIDSHLHNPMYFFLSNLSFVDIAYTSSVAPKMLYDFFKKQKTISFVGCAAQMFVFIGMGGTECCLLAAMAYDQYIAISNPLLYAAVMPPSICMQMAMAAHVGGIFTGLLQTISVFHLYFCGPDIINHFFCDVHPLLTLSCSSTFTSQVVNFIVVCMVGGTSATIVLVSYLHIIVTVLKIHSARGLAKAFNTWASHLLTVVLFIGSGLFAYLHPIARYSQNQDKVVAVFYGALIPMLNPIIYSLRSKEIKDALEKLKEKRKQMSIFFP